MSWIVDDLVSESVLPQKIYPPDTPLDEILRETGGKSILRVIVNVEQQENK